MIYYEIHNLVYVCSKVIFRWTCISHSVSNLIRVFENNNPNQKLTLIIWQTCSVNKRNPLTFQYKTFKSVTLFHIKTCLKPLSCCYTICATVCYIINISGLHHTNVICFQFWKVFAAKVAFLDIKDLFVCSLLLYYFRVFERRFGSRKFCVSIIRKRKQYLFEYEMKET